MKTLQKKVFQGSFAGFIAVLLISEVSAEETIIKQEQLSFERCLQVITTSQDKLSIAPEITEVSDKACLRLCSADGTLQLVSGVKREITVSTSCIN